MFDNNNFYFYLFFSEQNIQEQKIILTKNVYNSLFEQCLLKHIFLHLECSNNFHFIQVPLCDCHFKHTLCRTNFSK